MALVRTRAVLTGLPVGGDCLSYFYWDAGSTSAVDTLNEGLARVRAMFVVGAAAILSGGTINFPNQGDILDPSTGQITGEAVGTVVAPVSTTGAGDALPAQTQGLIRYRTSDFVNGHRVQGRTYIPAPTETLSQSGYPTIAYINSLNSMHAKLGTMVTIAVSQMVWHRPSISGPGSAHVVTSRSASPDWASQRGRRT